MAALLAGLAFATVWHTTAAVALTVPVRLSGGYESAQRADLLGGLTKLLLLLAATQFRLNAAVATLAHVSAGVVQRLHLERHVSALLGPPPKATDGEARSMATFLKPLAVPTLFFAFQGQVAVWLVGSLGFSADVADLGAISRFSGVFGVLGAVLTTTSAAAFSRCKTSEDLGLRIKGALAAAALSITPVLLLFLIAPRLPLLLLGSPYLHLEAELRLLALTSALSVLAGLLWALDSSRGWVRGAWLLIPLTLASQALAVHILSPSTVLGALLLSLAHTASTSLVYTALAVRGWRAWRRSHP